MSKAKEKLVGKNSVAKAEGGELLWFCRSNRHRRVATMRPQALPSYWALTSASRGSSSIRLSYNCHVHRTVCHHARRNPLHRAAPKIHTRGAKTKTTVKLKDLPQGVLKLEAYDDRLDNAPQYPTVVQGHRNNMQKFQNCVVLTRVGGFYEV